MTRGMDGALVVEVPTPSRAYRVHIGRELLEGLGAEMRRSVGGDAAFIVSDTHVAPLYLESVVRSLEQAGYRVATHAFPAGEEHKRLTTFGEIVEAMAEAGLTRASVVVALGGGVVGDMAGFAAASYMRGIRVVQVPTSLLAMVDSSVGGKTAIDLAAGKNLVGAFLQPSLVVADVDCLRTLEADVFVDGMGEVVKHGVLADPTLFVRLEERPIEQGSDAAYLARIVARNIEIKRDVVVADEREQGLRQTLNLGHTLGHAVEAAQDFELGHGHCVAIGLCAVARATEALGWSEQGLSARIERCVEAQGLPTDTDLPHELIYDFATRDKKRAGSGVNLVVPERIGEASIRHISLDELRRVIELGCGSSARRG